MSHHTDSIAIVKESHRGIHSTVVIAIVIGAICGWLLIQGLLILA